LDDLRSDNFSSIHYVNSRNGGLVHPPRPVAIKIDVEGHELAVLQGAVGVLDIDRPVIIAEVLTEQALTDLTHFLEAHNYAAEKVTGERNAIFLPAEKVADMTAEYDLWCGKRSRKLPIHGRILTSFAIPL
jgi:hypothetical protein